MTETREGLTLVNVVVLLAGLGTTSGGLLRGLVGEGVHCGLGIWGRLMLAERYLLSVGNWV